MGIYEEKITIPANTLQANAVETNISVEFGILHKVDVNFPSGVNGLVHVQLYDTDVQIFPRTRGSSITGNGLMREFQEYWKLNTSPRIIKVLTWNLDDTYSHTITVTLSILPEEIFKAQPKQIIEPAKSPAWKNILIGGVVSSLIAAFIYFWIKRRGKI